MLRCTSPGLMPIQRMVVTWPTGYEVWVCSTSFGLLVVPDVKYSSSRSSALVFGCGTGLSGASAVSA